MSVERRDNDHLVEETKRDAAEIERKVCFHVIIIGCLTQGFQDDRAPTPKRRGNDETPRRVLEIATSNW